MGKKKKETSKEDCTAEEDTSLNVQEVLPLQLQQEVPPLESQSQVAGSVQIKDEGATPQHESLKQKEPLQTQQNSVEHLFPPLQQIPRGQWGPPQQQQQSLQRPWGPQSQVVPPQHSGQSSPSLQIPPGKWAPLQPQSQWGQQRRPSGIWGLPQQKPPECSQIEHSEPNFKQTAVVSSQLEALETSKIQQADGTPLSKVEIVGRGRGQASILQGLQQSQSRCAQLQQHGRQQPGGQWPTTSDSSGDSHKIVAKQERINTSHGDIIDLAMKIQRAGKNGRPITVLTNHFPLLTGKVKQSIHYDVAIDPDKPKKAMRIVMEQFRKRHFQGCYPAYDGMKNMYSPTDLPFGETIEGTVVLILDDGVKPKEFKVKVKKVAIIDLTVISKYLASVKNNLVIDIPMNALQVIETVLRHSFAAKSINVGRSLFSMPLPTSKVIPLGNGMEMYRGVYQAVNLGWKPFVNIDVVNKAFPQAMHIIDLIKQLGQKGHKAVDLNYALDHSILEVLEKHIKGLRVTYCIPNIPSSKKTYRVNGIDECPRNLKFKKDDKPTPISVENYFLEKKVRLQYPFMPCLWIGPQQSNIKVPAEFCKLIPGQVINKRLGPFETREMIRYCATDTNTRRANIQHSLKIANFNQDPTVRSFDLSVKPEFQEINARVLTPPDLLYANNHVVKVQKGVWNPGSFFNGVNINSWTILNLDRRTERKELEELISKIKNIARQLKINISDQILPPTCIFACPSPDLLMKLKDYFDDKRKKGVSIVFVIISEVDKIYSYVKEASEITSACLTQCIKSRTLMRLTISTVSNILLKVNAKLNGINHIIRDLNPLMKNEITMIMGADVTHPSPDSWDIPSVAAITASHEPRAFQYNICWRLQPPKVEVIQDMETMIREQILYFARKNNTPPTRIIFYRDGVSDGQFRDVLRSELLAIRKACGAISSTYKPKITFLVVQKRHHTRLFPKNPHDSQDKNFNVPAGTCVDTEIVNPTCQNFFLVSHASIQGVAKPTKYVTLWDDSDFSSDEIESLTYYLCHMFARCNRSVSYPAPTYYAHLAAARAKAYIETKSLNMERLEDEAKKLIVNNAIIKDLPMFFI